MHKRFAIIAAALMLPRVASFAQEPSAAAEAPAFFAFCMDTHDSARRTLEQQAQLLRELGYDGAGHLWLDGLAERITTLDAAGLRLFQVYLQVNIAPDAPPYDARLEEALPLLRGRDCMLALLVNGMPPSDPAGDARAVAVVREIADAARAVGARVVLYPHAGFWLERIEDGLRVAEQVERPNVGVMFNLCHWLKADGESELRALLARAMPRLWAVSIHGADTAAEVQAGTGAMIRPLDEGAFDVRGVVRLLAELRYAGPIGLQCYGIPGDAREHLSRSIAVWETWQYRMPALEAGPVVAATAEERERLRAAWRGTGPDRDVVERVVAAATAAIARPLEFPPRGGQHNQWYQCDACQLALETVDPTHHRCPGCDRVYTGPPYDDVLFARVHGANLQGMADAAWAFGITGEARFADHARAVLLGYAERYRAYPYHTNRADPTQYSASGGHLAEQTLNEASAMTREIAPAYDLLRGAGALATEHQHAIREGLLLPMLQNIGKHRAGKSNWQTWHNAAMLWGGAALGEETWVDRALTDPGNGFFSQMRESVTADGMWYENSWGYHFYTLQALVQIAEGARRLGIDLWRHPGLRSMFTLPLHYAMPDGSLPRFGDDVSSSVRGAAPLMELAYARFADPILASALPDRPTWESVLTGRRAETAPAPVLASRVFDAAGHAILRSTGEAGLAAAMTFGPFGGFHGHFDKLTFVLFGYGRELGVDPGRARSQAYRLPVHRDWYRATIGHNAVIVEGQSQEPAAGRLEFFAANGPFSAVRAICAEAYAGTEHRRLLCLAPEYLLVLDELASDAPHRFTWVYHNRGTTVRSPDLVLAPGVVDEGVVGAEYVEQVRTGTTPEMLRMAFEDGDLTTWLIMAAGGETAVTVGDGVGASRRDRVPLVMASRHGPEARFTAVLEPTRSDQPPRVEALTCSVAGETLAVRIDRDGEADRLEIAPGPRLRFWRGPELVLEAR